MRSTARLAKLIATLIGASIIAVLAAPSSRTTADSHACVLHLNHLSAVGCAVTASDSGRPDPAKRWHSIDCQEPDRVHHLTGIGDGRSTAGGKSQVKSGYRRIHVVDGDQFYGERCELGLNSHTQPTFSSYQEGDHRVTFVSMRFPHSYGLGRDRWQTVLQMKQSEPSTDAGHGPVLEMQAFDGQFVLQHDWQRLWTTPAKKDRWIRIAFNVHYSSDPGLGSVQVYLDLNGDGDALDPHEHSPVFHTDTLNRESGGRPIDQLAAGASIPSHLRVGIYHDPAYHCPPPDGCAIDIDNVQVVNPD